MDRKRPFAELSLAVASAVAAGALFWWLLAQRSESPILGRVGEADGLLAPGAALHWSWTEPAAVRTLWLEARASDRYESVLEPEGGAPIVRSWSGGDTRGYVRETIDLDAALVGLSVRATGAGRLAAVLRREPFA